VAIVEEDLQARVGSGAKPFGLGYDECHF
jgi:hypothetical protein